ncbi:MAG TPA: HAD hydrolase-like protein [Streptosporangiaceae bacterium]|nr:HAD hydrolase-like protein [Streptosporangiaceae bacterium]
MLFDLDGVLVDSLKVVERAWRRWAAEQGLDTDEVLAVIHGRRAAEIVRKFAPHLDPAEQVRRITGFELAGVLAGQRAGMTVLAVTTTHPADALTQADQVFPGMGAVAGYLRGQARSDSPRV